MDWYQVIVLKLLISAVCNSWSLRKKIYFPIVNCEPDNLASSPSLSIYAASWFLLRKTRGSSWMRPASNSEPHFCSVTVCQWNACITKATVPKCLLWIVILNRFPDVTKVIQNLVFCGKAEWITLFSWWTFPIFWYCHSIKSVLENYNVDSQNILQYICSQCFI